VPPGADPADVTGGRILDLTTGTATWFLTRAGVYRLGQDGVRGPLRDANLERIGPLVRLAGGGRGLWVAGQGGIARLDPQSGIWESFTVPADLPSGPVLDVLSAGDDVWVATPAGAVRLRWR
jgi:ligand-binding sensor domain-containing protein